MAFKFEALKKVLWSFCIIFVSACSAGGESNSPQSNISASASVSSLSSITTSMSSTFSAQQSVGITSSDISSSSLSSSSMSSSQVSSSNNINKILALYKNTIEQPVTQNKCIFCHKVGGVSGSTQLIFIEGDDQAESNFTIIQNFVTNENLGADYFLTKVQGGAAHQGGAVFGSSSTEFKDLQEVINLMVGKDTAVNKLDIFKDVIQANSNKTLRRAALIIAGRLPTQQEYSLAENNLPAALRGLMNGDGFHQFLLRAANDKLLTDAFNQGLSLDVLEPNASFYPALAEKFVTANQQGNRTEFYRDFYAKMRYGAALAPLKLIAHIAENDLPYTQILTANYTMANPQLAEVYNADVERLFTSQDYREFKPVYNRGQILHDNQFTSEFVEGIGSIISSHGDYVSYPHAGILNEPAFLNRYPTTETNRNRARARWAYYHFLGVDIEKSAARTSDPDALADTNNPTMNNASCTVCHITMDPVAASFQNYGNEGLYRNSWGGLDALPQEYKNTDLYQNGDTWFSDVRAPGFNGTFAANDNFYNPASSLQWLASQIVKDERFAQAAIKFWWPALMAEELLEAPEVIGDKNYTAKLAAFDAQNTFINELAKEFKAGINDTAAYSGKAFNLKDALTKMLLSPWFRAISASKILTSEQKDQLEGIGSGRLLTPEELEAKTTALIGYAWGEATAPWLLSNRYSNLMNRYLIYYGGIDSLGITARARELNTLMANVALTQATSVACGAVVLDVNRMPEPALFDHANRLITPVTHNADQQKVEGLNSASPSLHRLAVDLPAGVHNISLQFADPYWDNDLQENTQLIITQITLKNANNENAFDLAGQNLINIEGFTVSLGSNGNATGGRFYDNNINDFSGYVLWGGGITLPVTIPTTGGYTLEVQAWHRGVNNYPVNMALAVNHLEPYGNSQGELKIREQLVKLHNLFLGESLTLNSEEIDASFNFIVDTWQWRQQNRTQRAYDWESEACDLPIENWWQLDMTKEFADPHYMQGTWISFLVYLMTDYLYLHE